MSFQDNRLFAPTSILQPLPEEIAQTPPSMSEQQAALRFLVIRDKAFRSWWGSLKTLCSPSRLGLYTTPARLFQNTPLTKFRFAAKPLLLSILLHIAGFLWYPYLPSWTFAKLAPVEAASAEPTKIYYRLTLAEFAQKFPRVTVAGPGGRAGSGFAAEKLPVLGSTAQHPKITIVLRPPKIDNHKQTIHQSQSAPDLRITMDLKLPNLVAGAAAPLRPKVYFTPNVSKPVQTQKTMTAAAAPEVTSSSSSVIPVSALAASQPHLPVPPPSQAATNGNETLALPDGAILSGRDGNSLIIVGVDPQSTSASLALPPGNRWAELSVSPAGGAGSPGGARGGVLNAGRGGTGTGGDGSVGVGHGDSGGGGKSEGTSGILSSTGGASEGSRGEANPANPVLPANLVYAVPAFVRPRRDSLIVSAGPMGGGGLDAYGALHCGKIYSVFLPMPGKSWTLQFCESKRGPAPDPQRSNSSIVRLESGLTPPDAESKFDFRRLPLPPESVHKVILLKGLIRDDGTVDQVQVYRGVQPQMDEAARLAFLKWKFKPAIHEGHPVSVDILVGVPSDAPVAARSMPSSARTQ